MIKIESGGEGRGVEGRGREGVGGDRGSPTSAEGMLLIISFREVDEPVKRPVGRPRIKSAEVPDHLADQVTRSHMKCALIYS